MNEDKKNEPELRGKEAIKLAMIPLLLAFVVFAMVFLG